ncbi:HAD-IA family hydrolase [candidate division GN15 bacterium]|nr:HAD-IA family hydrolase [candidate division GN15 bacterium]
MDKLTPKAVIFDLGSTLLEYEAIPWDELGRECAEASRQFLISKKLTVPDQVEFNDAFELAKASYREKASTSWEEWSVPMVAVPLLKKLGLPCDEEFVDLFFDAYYEPVEKHLYVYEDTLETLEAIKRRYAKVGLVSNTVFPERAHRKELARFGIGPYLDFAIFSSTFKWRKPHPDIFYKAANMAGFAPSECVYTGDRYLEDVQGPNSVGMPGILKVKPGREYPVDMPEDVRKIDALSELRQHFDF